MGLHKTRSVFAQILVCSHASHACHHVKHVDLNSTYHLHPMLQCMLRIRLRTIRKPAWRGIRSRGVRSIMAAYLCESLRRTCQMASLTARRMQEYRREGLAESFECLDSKLCVTESPRRKQGKQRHRARSSVNLGRLLFLNISLAALRLSMHLRYTREELSAGFDASYVTF